MGNKMLDRPWLYPTHPEHETFLRLLVAAVSAGNTDTSIHKANEVMDILEGIRTGGVVKEQIPPKQPRVQPVDDPNLGRTFHRLADGTQFIRGAMGNLEIRQSLMKVVIQRADIEEAISAILRENFSNIV